MSKKLKLIATLVCLSFSLSIFAEELVFIKDDLRTGINRAASEGKLVFLEFSASYCTPCKMMEEYTFTNPSVIERMNSNYVPVKVDIQSFDGFDLKGQYKVTVLPTIIILDSKGRQVARYEEAMAANQLNSVLDKHNLPKNRLRVATSIPNPMVSTAPTPTYNRFSSNRDNTPSVSTSASVASSPISSYNNVSAAKPTAPATVINTQEVGERRAIPNKGFTIQTGAYGRLESAQKVALDMQSRTGSQKHYIMQSKTNNKVTYRIFIGNFTSHKEADAFRKKAAIEGFVRGFSDFAKKG